jgi:hypothetical protein
MVGQEAASETPRWADGLREFGFSGNRGWSLARRKADRPAWSTRSPRLADHDWIRLRGLPVTLPSRIASDLLYDQEDPEAVAYVIADAVASSTTRARSPRLFDLRRHPCGRAST